MGSKTRHKDAQPGPGHREVLVDQGVRDQFADRRFRIHADFCAERLPKRLYSYSHPSSLIVYERISYRSSPILERSSCFRLRNLSWSDFCVHSESVLSGIPGAGGAMIKLQAALPRLFADTGRLESARCQLPALAGAIARRWRLCITVGDRGERPTGAIFNLRSMRWKMGLADGAAFRKGRLACSSPAYQTHGSHRGSAASVPFP